MRTYLTLFLSLIVIVSFSLTTGCKKAKETAGTVKDKTVEMAGDVKEKAAEATGSR